MVCYDNNALWAQAFLRNQNIIGTIEKDLLVQIQTNKALALEKRKGFRNFLELIKDNFGQG